MKYLSVIGAVGLSFIFSACQKSQQRTELKTLQDTISYSIGVDISKNLKGQMIEVNPDALAQALKDMSANGKPILTEEQTSSAMMAFQSEMMAKHSAMMKEAGEKNIKEGQAFLAENKKKDGVVTLPSGLQYKILVKGTGRKPGPKDNVSVNYRGSLVDGTEFDSSEKHGGPAVFPVGGVIKGLSEALQLMPVGSKWQIVVPPEIGYGSQAMGSQITPNSVLIFEIDLLAIK
ncbi:MAG TPA: FKBP-type peptidyl-prolyl cis-trans isomerase [Bacteroidota bacterium]|nr:FKBP-type peptidyl-prolyl cis-trans isomerase [Bacteroidota bacterium]